jgi:HD-like signal output (HDOD) protein
MIVFVALVAILAVVLYHWLRVPSQISHNQKTVLRYQTKYTTNTAPQDKANIPILSPPILSAAMTPPPELTDFKLLCISEDNKERIAQILKVTQSVPRPHPMVRSLMADLDDTEKLFEIVRSDPEIAAKILQTVNSAGFYLTQKITRLNQAIMYMGANMVKNIALQCVINTKASSNNKVLAQAFERIWANAFLASSLAFVFAKNMHLPNAAELATQTLLGYIGNLAIISHSPELANCFVDNSSLFERVTLEQQILGANSALIGSQLALEWQLPQEIITGISNSLMPLGFPPDKSRLQGPALRTTAFCYFCCRAAEALMSKNLLNIGELNLFDPPTLECFYLSDYIRTSNLLPLFTLIRSPAIQKEVGRFLAKY